jgi:hypothetical protein
MATRVLPAVTVVGALGLIALFVYSGGTSGEAEHDVPVTHLDNATSQASGADSHPARHKTRPELPSLEEASVSQSGPTPPSSTMDALLSEEAYVSIDTTSSALHAQQEAPHSPYMQTLAKERLGIDAEEVFGVDLDVEREQLRVKMRKGTTAQLEQNMMAQGMDPQMAQNVSSIKKAMMDKAKNSPPGVYVYSITVDP